MAGFFDFLSTPQGIATMLAGVASAGTGNQSYLDDTLTLGQSFKDLRAKRDKVERAHRAYSQLPALLEPLAPDADPAMAAARRQQVWALLPDIAPEGEMGKGLIDYFLRDDHGGNRDPRTSTDFNDLATMLGRPPTQEEMLMYKATGGGGVDKELDRILKANNIKKLEMDLQTGAETRADAIGEKDRKFASNQAALTRNFERLNHLADLAEGIRGTIVETGAMPEIRRQVASGAEMAGRWAGFDTKKLGKDVSNAELLSKGLNTIVQDTLQRFGNNISDSRQTLLQNSSANPSMKADSIRNLLADIAETYQDESTISGYNVDQKKLGEFIERMRTPLPPLENQTVVDVPKNFDEAKAAAGRAIDATEQVAGKVAKEAKIIVRRAADIGRMTQKQIEQIDPAEIADWGEEQKAALDKRMRELGF